MRILIGVHEVSGYYRGLKEGFQALGVPVTFLNLAKHRYAYGGEDFAPFSRLLETTRRRGPEPEWMLLRAGLEKSLVAWALARHDAFILSHGESLLWSGEDLDRMRNAGKKVVLQFHGSDSRPPYLDGSLMAPDRGITIAQCIEYTREKKEKLARLDRVADAVVNIPPTSHFHERPVVDWLRIGLPTRPIGYPRTVRPRGRAPVRIVHAPSHPAAKGTPVIEAAISALVARGLKVELIKVQGLPNQKVLEALESAELVVDQAYSDYAMPGLAAEAAWFGCPTVIGGYSVGLWERQLPPELRPPTAFCHPGALAETIEALVLDPLRRRDLGLRAREFVETQWSPARVAERYLRVLSNDCPADWMFSPHDIDYWQGACQSEEVLRPRLRRILAREGPSALCLEDKPSLRDRLVAEASAGL